METKGRYRMKNHVDEVEEKIKEMIEDCEKCISNGEYTLVEVDEENGKVVKELIYDLDTELVLFKHLLDTITMWRSTVCITEEKLI